MGASKDSLLPGNCLSHAVLSLTLSEYFSDPYRSRGPGRSRSAIRITAQGKRMSRHVSDVADAPGKNVVETAPASGSFHTLGISVLKNHVMRGRVPSADVEKPATPGIMPGQTAAITKITRTGDRSGRLDKEDHAAPRPSLSRLSRVFPPAAEGCDRDELSGSYRGLIYIVIYQEERGVVSWSASLEDDDGEVIFIASHFVCSLGKSGCESAVRRRIFASIDDYHRIHETPDLH